MVAVAKKRGHEVFAPSHKDCSIYDQNRVWLVAGSKHSDVIINCAGVLDPNFLPEMIRTNSIGPYVLARTLGIRMIHMSTDCVFSGRSIRGAGFIGPRLQSNTIADPMDLYGRSKLLGELMHEDVIVVRGSFIDPSKGFLYWLLNARGRVDAWMSAYWNGTSARRMAGHLVDLAEKGSGFGVYHIASPTSVSKAWMVGKFVEELDLRLDLKMVKEPDIWRVLEPDIETIPVEAMCDELIAEIQEARNDN